MVSNREFPSEMRVRHLKEIYESGQRSGEGAYPRRDNPYDPASDDGITWLAGYLLGKAQVNACCDVMDEADAMPPR
jgi:hypothetical protein